uniref:Uncharacterized protein n=1 Tax=Siphoviridae sp. ctCIv11 TaxID=2827806 RepID=A0A8S5S2L6_9CAUD|nr:MAG TPA: hypothetical protein [Siphoviridae sp. ctCIv11]
MYPMSIPVSLGIGYGSLAQLVRATGSYPVSRRFESYMIHYKIIVEGR